jgi:hypothetical protein
MEKLIRAGQRAREYRVTQLFEQVRAGCAADALRLPFDAALVLNHPSKEHDETCFSLATVRAIHKKSPKRLAVFDLLLARGGDPNYVFLNGTTLFQLAVWANDLLIVRRFMQSPALRVESTQDLLYPSPITAVMQYMYAFNVHCQLVEQFGAEYFAAVIADDALEFPALLLQILSREDRRALAREARNVGAASSTLLTILGKGSAARLPAELFKEIGQFLLLPMKARRGWARLLPLL